MKKTILLMLFLSALTGVSQEKLFRFGFLLNTNVTSLSADPEIGTVSPQLAFGGSAFARLKILFLYAELDAGYSAHEVNVSNTVMGTKFESNYVFNGLDLSGILGWRVIGIGKLGNFRLFTGFNINNYSNIKVTLNGSSVSDPSINTGNSAFLFGTGVDIWRIVFNLKYNIGITDLSSLSTQEMKSNSFVVSLGIKF
jgi:hypothetical protein